MKILKERSRTYKGKPYYKYKINLPEKLLKKAGFKAGDELRGEASKNKIVLRSLMKNERC